jgi:regulator of replication initiation timing
MKKNVINQIKELLGMEVKLATMKLSDGVTILEAEIFEAGAEVFVVAEDQKIALPVGEYELEDGKILVVSEEGIIAEIKDAPMAEEEMPMEEPEAEVPVEAEAEAPRDIKKTVESIVKETFFSEMEALKLENEELKAKLEMFSKVEPTTEVATKEAATETKIELEEVTPIVFNPENVNKVEAFKIAPKRPRSTMDSILEKLNK